MKRYLFIILASVFCLALSSWESSAQDRKLVTGRIINKSTGKPFGKNDIIIEIYGFDTEAQAEDIYLAMKSGDHVMVNNAYIINPPDETGYFSAVLPPTGAIVVKPGIAAPILVNIKNRSEISLSVDVGQLITAATKTERLVSIGSLVEEVEIKGNYLEAIYNFKLPHGTGSSGSRLILQPILIDATTTDTLDYLKPWIYDGAQYSLTQERRMSYDVENDPLSKYIRPEHLTSDEFIVPWSDTVYLANPMGHYYIKGKLLLEDYNIVYYLKDSLPMASSRARRPMRFLDYQLDFRNLDPQKYFVHPRPEKLNANGEMSLTFVVNKAELDRSNPENESSLNKLRDELLRVTGGENSRLSEFHIVGVASPDGNYQKNLQLAKERTQYAFNQVISAIPTYQRKRIYTTNKSVVASWSEVISLLEAEGHKAEASEVKSIIAGISSHDAQGTAIRRLPYYRSLISPLLPKLRTVKYTYSYEELRELTPEEIMHRYRNDKDYSSGKKHFAMYEYWHLFRMIEDPKELEALYRRAYRETGEDNAQPWIFAANNLAYTLLKKNQPDTTILSQFIDERFKCNWEITHIDGTKEKINPPEVVANQLCMYLMNNDFTHASILSQMLPNTDEYRLFKAITMCLGGYYKGGATDEERRERSLWYELVKESSPRNKVVMLLALNTMSHTLLAEKAVDDLPDDDPLTWYFRAIISGRKCNYPEADFMEPENFYMYLQTCFDMDKTYVGIARTDGDIDEDELKQFFQYNPQYDKF